MAQTIAGLLVKLGIDQRDFEKDINKAARTMRGLGSRLTSIGSSLTAGISLPLAGVAAASLKASVSFESAFAGVRKTVNATEQQFSQIRSEIRNLATSELPQSASEIAKVAEVSGQLGVGADDIVKFTTVVSKLGATTTLSAEEAATSLARFSNITQTSLDNVDELGDIIVELGNNLATTEGEITSFGLRIAGAGSQIGLTNAEILGFGAALSSVGINAEAGGTAISRVFVEISKTVASGGKSLEEFAEVAGLSVDDFSRLFREDASEAILRFIEGLGEIQKSGGDTFAVLDRLSLDNVRVRDALLRSAGAGDLMRQSLDLANKAVRDGNATNVEFAKRMETTGAQIDLLRNRLIDVGITIGEALEPAFRAAISVLQTSLGILGELAAGFKELPVPIQAVVLGIGAFAVALGPVLFAVGKFIRLGASFVSLMTAGAGPIGLAAAAVIGLGTAIGVLASSSSSADRAFNSLIESTGDLDDKVTKSKAAIKEISEEIGRAEAQLSILNDRIAEGEKLPIGRARADSLRQTRLEASRVSEELDRLRVRLLSTQQIGQQAGFDRAFRDLEESLSRAQKKFELVKDTVGQQRAEFERAEAVLRAYERAVDDALDVGATVEAEKLAEALSEQRQKVDELAKSMIDLGDAKDAAGKADPKAKELTAALDELTIQSEIAQNRFGIFSGSIGDVENQIQLTEGKIRSLEQAIDSALVIGTDEAIATAGDLVMALEAENLQLEQLKEASSLAAEEQRKLNEQAQFQSTIWSQLTPSQQQWISDLDLSAEGTRRLAEQFANLGEQQRLFLLQGSVEWAAWKEQMDLILSDTNVQLALFSQAATDSIKSISDNFGQALAQTLVFGKSFSKTFANLMKQFVAQVIASFLSLIAQMIVFRLITAKTVGAQAQSTIIAKAAETFAGAYASVIVGVPYPYNLVLAPIVAAAEQAAVLSVGTGLNAAGQAVPLAEGGIVANPTLALIGEGTEPEAVMPLSQLDRFASSGSPTTINVLLDGEVVTTAVLQRLPEEVNLATGI